MASDRGFSEQFFQLSQQQQQHHQRLPKSIPRVLGGSGQNPEAASETRKPLPVGSNPVIQEANNPVARNKALLDGQRYVPGLHTKEEAEQLLPQSITKKMARVLPKELPPGLYDDFLNGKKHPISCLMEYCASTRLIAIFKEAPVLCPSIIAKFASVCSINGREFPQGVGKTKKDAKTEAARIAFTMMLGIDDGHEEEGGETLYDSHGKKIMMPRDATADWEYSAPKPNEFKPKQSFASDILLPKIDLPERESVNVTPHWDQSKHPVQIVMEYCQKNHMDCKVVVDDNKSSYGFRAKVLIEGDEVGEAYAQNKKEAKKKAAEDAIKNFLPKNYADLVDCEPPSGVLPGVGNDKVSSYAADNGGPSYEGYTGVEFGGQSATTSNNNSVNKLEDYCKQNKYSMKISVSDIPGPDGYEARVVIDSQEWGFATASSIKEARQQVAEVALDNLENCSQPDPLSVTGGDEGTHYDVISHIVWQAYSKSLRECNEDPRENVPLAAFVLRRSKSDRGEVVAFASGGASLSPGSVPSDGRTLLDCHAVVLARRALLKYLYKELTDYYQKEVGVVHSIFEEQPGETKLKVKDHVTVHLYMSCAPCGDAYHYTRRSMEPLTDAEWEIMQQGYHYPDFSKEEFGMLRGKPQYGFQTEEVKKLAPGSIRLMSCSDKLLKWNNIGLQGALLTHFVEPIYISSITMGFMYDHGHITRAVSGRVTDDLIDHLPPGYQSSYPYIGRVTKYDLSFVTNEPSVHSLNWSLGDDKLEILDGTKGRSVEDSPFRTGDSGASRLAKAGFLFRFRKLAQSANKQHLIQHQYYKDAKAAAKEYQDAKIALYEHVASHGFGRWIRHPPTCEHFVK